MSGTIMFIHNPLSHAIAVITILTKATARFI